MATNPPRYRYIFTDQAGNYAAIVANTIVVSAPSGVPILTDICTVNKIRWVGASTAGHQVRITDQNGLAKFASIATGANYVESETWDQKTLFSDGLTVPTLDSGVLYIYVETGL